MRFLPPLLMHGSHRASQDEVAAHVDVFGQRLASWPEWPEIAEMAACEVIEVGAQDRPST